MIDFSTFPFEVIETTSQQAFATWEALRTAGRGTPLILGDDFENLLFPFDPDLRVQARFVPVEETLAAAAAMTFPADLLKRDDRDVDIAALLRAAASSDAWPAPPRFSSQGPLVPFGLLKDEPRPDVYIALIPTQDSTAIPAYMQWGNFNDCPSAAVHIAALRAWRDRYGAELVAPNADVLELRVARRPSMREEALDLARVLDVYCSDLISEPTVEAYQELAANLMATDWWWFWWD